MQSGWTGRSTTVLALITCALALLISKSHVHPALQLSQRILWLIAHPDDEAFFFTPSINTLLRNSSTEGYILSLSTGNAAGLGAIRSKELIASCNALGVEAEHCVALDTPALQDSMTDIWPESAILQETVRFVRQWDINTIITFDEYGVSGHTNHRQLAIAVQKAHTLNVTLPAVFQLRSSHLISKYTLALLLPRSLVLNGLRSTFSWNPLSTVFANSLQGYSAARRAFDAHRSQKVWFRHLNSVFSRFMWFNELNALEIGDT